MNEKIKVLICDDHTLFREGIKAILEDEHWIEIVGEAHDGRQAVLEVARRHPDVVLMDVAMPDLGGVEATHRILQTNPKTKILILTMYEEEEVIARCLDAGACGYILKDISRPHLIHAIEVVHSGGQYLSSRALKKVVNQYVKGAKSTATGYDRLTDREREVLKLLADGMALKEIAGRLSLSVKTVDVHKTNLMRKLDLHASTELIKYAIQRKLIRLPSVAVKSGRSAPERSSEGHRRSARS
jgi:DNA-binding NarL/FixJ family response regulator